VNKEFSKREVNKGAWGPKSPSGLREQSLVEKNVKLVYNFDTFLYKI